MVTWIRDAREHGLPVLVTGIVLLRVLDWPLGGAVLVVGMLMAVLLLVGASVTFPAPGDGSADR
jgi:hypothetical protein